MGAIYRVIKLSLYVPDGDWGKTDMCFHGPGDGRGAVRTSCPTGRHGQEQGSCRSQGWHTFPPRARTPRARHKLSHCSGRLWGWGGDHVLPQSIRQATSLRNPTFAYEHIQANRQPLTPVETQNREKTAIFKSEGLCIFGNRSQGCS